MGPPMYHQELYSLLCDDLYGNGNWKRVDVCETGSLFCTAETNTYLHTNKVMS